MAKKKNTKKSKYKKSTGFFCTVLILASLSVIFYGLYSIAINKSVSSGGRQGLENLELEHEIQGREGEKVSYFLICGLDDSKALTDVIMVAMYDLEHRSIKVLQIPRDTYIGGGKGIGLATTKLNSVYGTGLLMDWCEKCNKNVEKADVSSAKHKTCGKKVTKNKESGVFELAKTINSQFGIPINHYLTFTVEGFKNCVDAVGGVTADVPRASQYNGRSLKKGVQTLNGSKAEILFRYRDESGDIGRMEAQRQLWSGAAVKVLDMTQVEFATKVLPKVFGHFTTDMSIKELQNYKLTADDITVSDIEFFTVPGQGRYGGKLSYFSADEEEYIEMLNASFLPFGGKKKSGDIGLASLG